jgi:hypothetical protein
MPLSKIDSDSLSTPLTVPAGSAAAPAITTTGDTNTGIFFPAADTIAFAEGGAEAMRIDSSGRVGIGTTSPTGILNVKGTGGDAMPATSGSTQSAGLVTRLQQGGMIGSVMDIGGNGGGGSWIQVTEASNLATNYSLLLNPNGGNVLVGATSPSVTSSFQVKRSGGNPVTVHNNGGTSGYFNQILFLNNAGTADIGYINRVNDSSVQYVTTSDYRLKNTVSPMTGALAKVALLKPVTYKWNADGSDGEGFIAHELAEVVPQCVSGEKDGVNEDGKPVHQGIDTSFLVATLTAAIQELKAIVDAQGAEIAALKGTP